MVRKLIIGALAFVLIMGVLSIIGRIYMLEPAMADKPELPGRLDQLTLEYDGRTRSADVYVPASLKPAADLVLVLHGSDGDSARARVATAYDFDLIAEETGALIAYPNGFERHWNGCRAAGPYAANTLDVDDVGYLKALMDKLAVDYGASGARLVTGISNGGHMAFRMALEAPGSVSAIAPIIASLPAEDNFACTRSNQPAAVLIVNGTDDPMNPYEGGAVELYGLGNRGNVLSSEDSIGYWRDLAGYSGAGTVTVYPDADGDGLSPSLTLWQSAGQSAGKPPVGLLSVTGGGHSVPHPGHRFPRILGATNHDISAPREIWRFFEMAKQN